MRTKNEELNAASERAANKAYELHLAQQAYKELKERVDRSVEENKEPSPPPVVPLVSNPADVPFDLDDQEPDVDFDNPGIEEDDNEKAPFSKRKRLDHFDQMMAGLTHFVNETLATFFGHVQVYSAQQSAVSQENAVSSCGVPETRKISFLSLSPSLVKSLIFLPRTTASTGLGFQIRVPSLPLQRAG